MERKSKGRQKVEMVKMPNESNLQVTFSKRRSGLFKKASELCTLCGAEITIVVFSPGKKVFSFGHPSVEAVMERYVSRNPPRPSPTMQLIEAHRNATVRELNLQLTQIRSGDESTQEEVNVQFSQVTNQLEMEKKRGEELNQMRKASMNQFWWEKPIEELDDLSQLEQLKASMQQLRKNVSKQSDMLLIQNSHPHHHPQFFGSSSNQVPMLGFEPKNEVFNPDQMNVINHNQGSNHINQGFNNLGFGRGFF